MIYTQDSKKTLGKILFIIPLFITAYIGLLLAYKKRNVVRMI